MKIGESRGAKLNLSIVFFPLRNKSGTNSTKSKEFYMRETD